MALSSEWNNHLGVSAVPSYKKTTPATLPACFQLPVDRWKGSQDPYQSIYHILTIWPSVVYNSASTACGLGKMLEYIGQGRRGERGFNCVATVNPLYLFGISFHFVRRSNPSPTSTPNPSPMLFDEPQYTAWFLRVHFIKIMPWFSPWNFGDEIEFVYILSLGRNFRKIKAHMKAGL